jgi:hypothetical protein
MEKRGSFLAALIILVFVYLFIFILYLSLYNFSITGKIIQNVNLDKYNYSYGEKLKGNLTININKGMKPWMGFDHIPSNASFEIWVDGQNIKNYTFAEIINLSFQKGKGNFTYGVFRNVNGLAPAQKGWGFSYCQPPPNINITQKKERPVEVKGEQCSRQGETREFVCPDGINRITQICDCTTAPTPKCEWLPDNASCLEMCINNYSCINFDNKYVVDLNKLEIPLEDRNGDKNVEIKFRLVYRWSTKWNNNDTYCTGEMISIPCNMLNYAANWSPVCGEDNVTYPNACFARCQGMTEVACEGECPCPQQPGLQPQVGFINGVPIPTRLHEVIINEIKVNVSISLPKTECEWKKVCENNAEWNVTNRTWMIYYGQNARKRCMAAMCTLNNFFIECQQQSQPKVQEQIKIVDKCRELPQIPQVSPSPPIYGFSIYRCDYDLAIRILQNTPSIINILPDYAYIGSEIRDKIRDCPSGWRCINNECKRVGGGGGGGGGINYCYPRWQCSDYGECQQDGKRYRVCVDVNNCSISDIQWWQTTGCYLTSNPTLCLQGLIRPIEQQPCTIECQENWQCGDWSICEEGVQTRECVDLNNCGTTYNKPETSQPCQIGYQPPQQEEKKKFEWRKILIPILILVIVIIGIVVGILVTRRKPGIEIKQEIAQAEVPQELVEYVKNTLQQGASRKEIEEKLKQAGWPQDLINIAFEKVRQESKQ